MTGFNGVYFPDPACNTVIIPAFFAESTSCNGWSPTWSAAPGSTSAVDTLGETGIRGRAVFSTSNRRLMRRALGMTPNPRTVSELGRKLERVCAEFPCPEADAMLAAVRDASAEAPGRRLEELAARS